MNNHLKNQIICNLLLKGKSEEAFTLIELLIVILIIGILSAIAIPNYIQQIGKGREVELKNAIGTINRSQIAHHWEFQTFCCNGFTTEEMLKKIGININSEYISNINFVASDTSFTIMPENSNYIEDQTRGYSGGVFYDIATADYDAVICQSFEITQSTIAPINATDCGPNAQQIR